MLEWLGGYLNDFLATAITCLFYPVSVFVAGVWDSFANVYNILGGFVNSVYGLFRSLYMCIFGFLYGILPYSWVNISLTGLLVKFLQFAYSYLKNIEIAGFSI